MIYLDDDNKKKLIEFLDSKIDQELVADIKNNLANGRMVIEEIPVNDQLRAVFSLTGETDYLIFHTILSIVFDWDFIGPADKWTKIFDEVHYHTEAEIPKKYRNKDILPLTNRKITL